MSEKRIIKKYPNRRLYDTAISSYVTLEDVRRLILENVALQVMDVKSQADITHNTLLQIILDQESKGSRLFSTEILEQLIRYPLAQKSTEVQEQWLGSLGKILEEVN
jgi:polyhydroxyalkanoate synthesis repressor PhaR